MTRSAFVRARRPEHKQQRRDAILAAARDLATTSGVGNVSLSAVADAVGLAKSNISRYFETREAIYLELLAEEWRQYAAALSDRLRSASEDSDADTTAALTTVAKSLADRPLFCDLLSQLPTSLEHNVSVPAARAFKHSVYDSIATTSKELARTTRLTEQESAELLAAASGLAGLLYRAANPPPVLARAYAEDPELSADRHPMLPTLTRMVSALAAGLPTLRGQEASHLS